MPLLSRSLNKNCGSKLAIRLGLSAHGSVAVVTGDDCRVQHNVVFSPRPDGWLSSTGASFVGDQTTPCLTSRPHGQERHGRGLRCNAAIQQRPRQPGLCPSAYDSVKFLTSSLDLTQSFSISGRRRLRKRRAAHPLGVFLTMEGQLLARDGQSRVFESRRGSEKDRCVASKWAELYKKGSEPRDDRAVNLDLPSHRLWKRFAEERPRP